MAAVLSITSSSPSSQAGLFGSFFLTGCLSAGTSPGAGGAGGATSPASPYSLTGASPALRLVLWAPAAPSPTRCPQAGAAVGPWAAPLRCSDGRSQLPSPAPAGTAGARSSAGSRPPEAAAPRARERAPPRPAFPHRAHGACAGPTPRLRALLPPFPGPPAHAHGRAAAGSPRTRAGPAQPRSSPRRPPRAGAVRALPRPARAPCASRSARPFPEAAPAPPSLAPAPAARSGRRGGTGRDGAARPRRGPRCFFPAEAAAPPAGPSRASARRGCGQSGADRLGPVPRAGAGRRKQEAAAAAAWSGGDKGGEQRREEGRGLARLGPAQRAGVLAAGGRMVQKEGQAALEEPQGSPSPAGVPGAPLEPPGAAAGPVPGGEETDTETETALGSRRFLCGVVEGFYGRPWVMEQRKELFRRLQKWGLNTYLYAPKDDYKHRMFWREMYSVEEAEQLMTLISAAREHEIEFIYAISPGLDITFSNPKEVSTLKRKLDQVSQFGCRSFALLFDDIDHNMCAADKEVFSSFAHAQVSITNEIYQYLGEPDTFLFCPTEYCGTFCYPNVAQSPYLRTVGEKLLPGIEVLWTGPKVVSKDIPVESIEEVSKIIRRAPVIWDNIHANDYDQKRLFLGPYKGRSTELIPRLKGVLTNPNCEFEANYVAIHTLATWYKSNMNGVRKDVVMTDTEDSTVSIQIKLENEGSDEDIETDVLYSPQMALKLALTEWLQEFGVPQQYSSRQVAHSGAKTTVGDVGPLVSPSSLNAATVVTTVYQEPIMSQGAALSSESPALGKEEEKKQSDEEPMDMVVEKQDDTDKSANQILTDIAEAKMAEELKPMDTDKESIAESKSPEMSMQEDSGSDVAPMQTDEQINKEQFVPGPNEKPLYTVEPVTLEDLQLLADLFYLPYEHGPKGAQMLREFQWLRANSSVVSVNCKGKDAEKIEEWRNRAAKFEEMCSLVMGMFTRLSNCANRTILYDMYSYVWDIKSIMSMVKSFVQWLGCRSQSSAQFLSGDQEPWAFRGGLAGEFQRLLPIDGANDLFFQPPPLTPTSKVYTIRPYFPKDEASVYKICREMYADGADQPFHSLPDLIGDKLVGGLLTLSLDYCFVLEDEDGICGYALGTVDVTPFIKKCKMSWIPFMQEKYTKPNSDKELSEAEKIMLSFHEEQEVLPESFLANFPSLIKIDIHKKVTDPSVAKSMMACLLSSLKANGSRGAFCEVRPDDKRILEFYSKLGCFEIAKMEGFPKDVVILGRSL